MGITRPSLALLVCYVLVIVCVDETLGQNTRALRIGIPLTQTGKWQNEGEAMLNGFNLWKQKVYQQGGIPVHVNGSVVSYIVETVVVDVGASVNTTQSVVQQMMNGTYGQIDVVFAPYGSTLTPVAAMETEKYAKLLLSGQAASEGIWQCDERILYPCTRSTGPRFEYAFSVISPAATYFDPVINLVKIKGAQTMVIFYENEDFPRRAYQGALQTAINYRIDVIAEIQIPSISSNGTAEQEAMTELIEKLKDLRPDVVLGGTYYTACELFIRLSKKLNFNAKAVALTTCVDIPQLQQDLGEDVNYVMGVAQWSKDLEGRDYDEVSTGEVTHFVASNTSHSPAIFATTYRLMFDTEPAYHSASATAMGYVLEYIIQRSDSIDTKDWVIELRKLFDPSFFGKLGFNTYNTNTIKPVVGYQFNHVGNLQLVYPLASAAQEIIYPMPTWEERIYVAKWFEQPEEIAIAVVTAVCIVYALILLVMIIIYREHKYIKSASIPFCVFILLGALGVYASIFVWTMESSSGTCMARVWVAGLSFTVMFGSLLAKEWRISRVFSDKRLMKTVIPDKELLLWVVALLLVETVILLLWTSISPPLASVVIVDAYRPNLNYYQCSSDHELPFVILLIIFKGMCLCSGVYLAFQTRKVNHRFAESRFIGVSVYNLFFCGIILLIILFVDIESRTAVFVIRSICILFGITMTISALFLPRFFDVFYKKSSKLERGDSIYSRSAKFGENTFTGDGVEMVKVASNSGSVDSPTAMSTSSSGTASPLVASSALATSHTRYTDSTLLSRIKELEQENSLLKEKLAVVAKQQEEEKEGNPASDTNV